MYIAKEIKSISHGKGYWNTQKIGVYDLDHDTRSMKKIGSFKRDYPSFGVETFEPFKLSNNWYALYSPDYTTTQIMELPSCKNIGGEKPDVAGFCPVEIYIPKYKIRSVNIGEEVRYFRDWENEHDSEDAAEEVHYDNIPGPEYYATFAFVQGCVWGDDSSWKLTVFDISNADNGIIKKVKYVREEEWDFTKIPWKPKPGAKSWGFYEELTDGKLKNIIRFDDFSCDTEEEAKDTKKMQFVFSKAKTARIYRDEASILYD